MQCPLPLLAAPKHAQQFHTLDTSSLRCPSQIVSVPCEKQFRDRVSELQDGDVEKLVEYLDNVRLPTTFSDSDLVHITSLGLTHSGPRRSCFLEAPASARMGMRHSGTTTEVLHDFRNSLAHGQPALRLRNFGRYVRGVSQWLQSLRQEGADVFEQRPAGSEDGASYTCSWIPTPEHPCRGFTRRPLCGNI